MAEVACFCGCCYSFEGGAGACPRCGEYAVVATTHEGAVVTQGSATGRESADDVGLAEAGRGVPRLAARAESSV